MTALTAVTSSPDNAPSTVDQPASRVLPWTTASPLDRRTFLQGTAAAGAALLAPRLLKGEGAPQANGKYRTALIGSGWWGTNIVREAIASGTCTIVALCDVDESQLKICQAELRSLTADEPKLYRDYRELLDAEKPQIVINATPDHWHALITIAAVEAGADVYVEKPISHTILEGRAMVQAARRTDRMVQVGTHRRVSPHNMSGMKFLLDGNAGDIGMVRAFVHYPGGPGEKQPDRDPPKGLDWDMWCGPAPLVPYNSAIHPKGFRHFLQFANGQLGDWGIHWMDQILWWSSQARGEVFPRRVSSTGGRHIRRDNTDAPDTQIASFEFESFTATWEHRQYAGNAAEKHYVGCYFYGTKGTFHMGWQDGWTFYPLGGEPVHTEPVLNKPDDQNIRELWANFLQSVQSRTVPVCDIEVGHRSTAMSLLGLLSLKLGRSVQWDSKEEQIVDDAAANQLLRRDYRAPWQYPSIG
jgi:predicted dehydrogenase